MSSRAVGEPVTAGGSHMSSGRGRGRDPIRLSTAIFSGRGVSRAMGDASRVRVNSASMWSQYARVWRSTRRNKARSVYAAMALRLFPVDGLSDHRHRIRAVDARAQGEEKADGPEHGGDHERPVLDRISGQYPEDERHRQRGWGPARPPAVPGELHARAGVLDRREQPGCAEGGDANVQIPAIVVSAAADVASGCLEAGFDALEFALGMLPALAPDGHASRSRQYARPHRRQRPARFAGPAPWREPVVQAAGQTRQRLKQIEDRREDLL